VRRAISDRARPCIVCGRFTTIRCGDCLEARKKNIPICQRASCREDHELVHGTLAVLAKAVRARKVDA
jgi:hypothetical protein